MVVMMVCHDDVSWRDIVMAQWCVTMVRHDGIMLERHGAVS